MMFAVLTQKRRLLRLCLFFSVMSGSVCAYAEEVKTQLTYEEVIARSTQPDESMLGKEEQAAHERYLAMLGKWGPRLSVDAKVLLWDSASHLKVFDYPELDWLKDKYRDVALKWMHKVPNELELRGKFTTIVGVQLLQPLTPLFQVYQGMKMLQAAEKAVKLERHGKDLNKLYEVTDLYFKMVYANAVQAVVEQAITSIAEQVNRAEEFYQQGMVEKSVVLTAKLELSKMQTKLVEIQEKRTMAQLKLGQVLKMGQVGIVPMPVNTDAIKLPDLSACEQKALENRTELQRLDIAKEVARRKAKNAALEFVPKIALIGRYENAYNIKMQPKNQFFIGIGLDWTFWDNLETYHNKRAEQLEAEKAEVRLDDTKDLIKLDVSQKFYALKTALSKVQSMQVALSLAEEKLKIESSKFNNGESVSSEMSLTQTKYEQAQTDLIKARVDVLTGYANLLIAMGLNPELPGYKEQINT